MQIAAHGAESEVLLIAVDGAVLSQLVQAAVADATADEVTPPITPGTQWSDARVGWLNAFHTDRRAGLDGPCQETTWAVTLDSRVVGSVRLKRVRDGGTAEMGIWLTRLARQRGVGSAATRQVITRAAELGVERLVATTTSQNSPAVSLLERLGFVLSAQADGSVAAERILGRRGESPDFPE
ncbi:MAG: GNAT family N-acetyltransferase [Jatrophihabitantaceae bacterium]